MSAGTAEICQFHGYRLDVVRRRLLDPDGVPVPLMPKAIETLVYLIERAGQTVSKEELLRAVWPNVVVEENNLTQNISALRRAFGETLAERKFIVTIPGQGYRFVAPVSRVSSAAAEPVPAPASISVPTPKRRLLLGGAVALVAVLVVGAIAWRLPAMRAAAIPAQPRTIAILPFAPVVAGERNEALELGMADSLIMELSRSTHLIVRPLNATRSFVALDQDPLEAGRQLEVDAVVEGTMQVIDGRVRASARLLRVADGRQLWAGKFEERFAHIFDVQDAIAERVAAALQIGLEPRANHRTENVQAYELYMRGRLHALRLVMPEVQRGIEYYERAITEDPSYALPYAGIADALRALVLSNDMSPAEMAPRAVAAATRAIELAPDLPEANSSRGMAAMWLEWDWRAAETYLVRAVELAPNDADAQIYLAHVYSNLGRKEEALTHARRAREINPVSPLVAALEGLYLTHQGEHQEAVRRLEEAVSLEPQFWLSHHLLANALIDAGQYEAALPESAEAKRLSPLQTLSDAFGAIALARLGRKDEARAVLQSLSETARHTYVPPTHFALIETALGERDQAFAHLDAAFAVRDARLALLKIDPKWDDLRDDPRFAALLRRLNF
ncbi:MAG TPA: winged helix-turn-helix domain-containing protein [Steroidobacteraceae bacterium]|nr:winged helix-turn-helix domain-containing protein [Steroidobacteraceae bacterium]